MNADLSLSLTPFAVDGRQLLSDPCAGDYSTFTRYNQSETFEVCKPGVESRLVDTMANVQ
jgi:hypothetical protein